jgi:hypothetical protein
MAKSAPQSGIIRVEHDTKHPYKVINTGFANDERLTWGARGLLTYLLSKPDDWKVMVPDLIKQSPAGRDAVYAILKNLEDNGYLRRIRTRRADGTFEYSTVIYEKAQPLTAFPETDEPYTAEPLTEKPDVYRVGNALSKDELNKDQEDGGGGVAREAEKRAPKKQSERDEVVSRLFVIFENPKQIKGFIAAAAKTRGSFTLADVAICEAWLAESTYHGKLGKLHNILADGMLPPMKQAPPPQPVLTMADVKRKEAAYLAANPEAAKLKQEIAASGW